MSAGDIYLLFDTYLGHFSGAGSEIYADANAHPGGDTDPSLAHNGQHLFATASSGADVYQFDASTLTLLTTYNPETDGNGLGNGLAVRENKQVLCSANGFLALALISDDGTQTWEYVDYPKDVYGSPLSIAHGGHVLWGFPSGSSPTEMFSFDLDTSTYTLHTLTAPSGYPSATCFTGIAAKADGGVWVAWTSVGQGIFQELDASLSEMQVVALPSDSSGPGDYWDPTRAVDCDADDNLVLWTNWGSNSSSALRLARLASGSGGLTVLNAAMSDPYGISSAGALGALHVERAFGPSVAPWLRQLQRDDLTRQYARNGPSSVQASIRQGPRGTYL